jgi:hypothetical protein
MGAPLQNLGACDALVNFAKIQPDIVKMPARLSIQTPPGAKARSSGAVDIGISDC